jgi:hypothetical protein
VQGRIDSLGYEYESRSRAALFRRLSGKPMEISLAGQLSGFGYPSFSGKLRGADVLYDLIRDASFARAGGW